MHEHKFLDNPDLGKLLLRLGAGVVLFLHGFWKLHTGMPSTVELAQNGGWPGWIAYGTYIGEFVVPMLVIVGKFSRPAGLVMALNMLMTIVVVHREQAFQLNDYGAWAVELNGLLIFCGLAVAFLGAGRYSLSRGDGRWD